MTTTAILTEPEHSEPAWDGASQTWLLLLKAFRSTSDHIDEALAISGLPRMAEVQALVFIEMSGTNGLRATDLADALAMSRSNATRMAMKMEQNGLIHKRPSQSDKRELALLLTDRGAAICKQGMTILEETDLKSFPSLLSKSEFIKLIVTLGQLMDRKADTIPRGFAERKLARW